MIFLGFALLNDRNYVGVPVVIAALVIPACWAGCWMGFCLGNRGVGRSILRGFSSALWKRAHPSQSLNR
jgi:membrane protein DedA with SNARE-associated domain